MSLDETKTVGTPATHDHTDDVSEGGDELAPEVLAHAARVTNQQTDREDGFPRPIVSTEPQDVYVDPAGDDTNPGTSSEPVATVQEALNRLPLIAQHEHRILLKPGTYNFGASIQGPPVHFTGSIPPDQPFIMRSTTSTAADVTLTHDWLSLALRTSEPEGMIQHITFEGTLQSKLGRFKVKNVDFTGVNPGDVAAVTGHSGEVHVDTCDFAGAYDYVIMMDYNGRATLNNLTGSVGKYVARMKHGSVVRERNAMDQMTAPFGFAHVTEGSTFIDRDGEPYDHFGDDWGDGRLTERIGGLGGYRQEWVNVQGSIDVGDGHLIVPDGSTTTQQGKVNDHRVPTTGTFRATVQAQTEPTSGAINLFPWSASGGDEVFVTLRGGGDALLKVEDGGVTSTLVTGKWAADIEEHTVKVTRSWDSTNSTYDCELFVDGTSQGTASDANDVGLTDTVSYLSTLDADLHVKDWSMNP